MKVQDTIIKSRRLIRKILLLTALCVFLLNAGRAQGSAAAAIDHAMKAGDASAVSQYFGPSIDITVNNSTSTYSRTQGEQVLRDFFSRNSVRDFDIEHSGNSTWSNSTYTIGILQTANGNFKIYLFLRQKDNGFLLKEIRIEK